MTSVFKTKNELIKNLIKKDSFVLDVGFWGQGISYNNPNWPHRLIYEQTKNLYGLDLDYDETKLFISKNYIKCSAENFIFKKNFDIIFAGDLIEHLSNQGLFLNSVKKNLKKNGILILTTPNAFNLYTIIEKIFKPEPTVNRDHTCYYNSKTINILLKKNGFKIKSLNYIYDLETEYKSSILKKIQDIFYYIMSKMTNKYLETIVIVAEKDD